MAIELTEPTRGTSWPVLRHQRIGELAQLAIVRTEQRDRLRKNPSTNVLEKIQNGIKADGSPKYRQELVVHGVVVSSNMQVKAGDDFVTPPAGDRVRLILKGKGFGEWIEARKAHRGGRMVVGDTVLVSTTHAQRYDHDGAPKGERLTTQAEVDSIPRGVTVGLYGPLELVEGNDPKWIAAAEGHYKADEAARLERSAIPLEPVAAGARSWEEDF